MIRPGAVQHMPGDHQVAGDYKSRDEILAFYGNLAELTGGTYSVEPEPFFNDGHGTVTVVHRVRGERKGRTLDHDEALTFRVEGGQLVELTDQTPDVEADNEFWS